MSSFVVEDGLVTAGTDADGVKLMTYAYDAVRNLIAVTDSEGRVTRYGYDVMGNQIETITPLGHRSTTTYDQDGNVTSETDANGGLTTYRYDQVGRCRSPAPTPRGQRRPRPMTKQVA